MDSININLFIRIAFSAGDKTFIRPPVEKINVRRPKQISTQKNFTMFRRLNIISQVLRQQNIAYASTVAPKKKLIPLITCKHTQFNLVLDEHDGESDGSRPISEIKLASQNWQHYKAKGDHFIIHPVRDVIESNLKNSTDIHWFELDEQLTKNAIEKHDVEKMTVLQNEAINDIKLGKHVLIAAETGCGKVIDIFMLAVSCIS